MLCAIITIFILSKNYNYYILYLQITNTMLNFKVLNNVYPHSIEKLIKDAKLKRNIQPDNELKTIEYS